MSFQGHNRLFFSSVNRCLGDDSKENIGGLFDDTERFRGYLTKNETQEGYTEFFQFIILLIKNDINAS